MRVSKKLCLTILVMALMNVTASISFAAEESSGSAVNTPANTNTASPAQAGSGNSLLATIENLPSWFPKILGMQFNGVYQNMPAFHSPYQGQNSLTTSNGEGHAFSHTYGVYLGSQLLSTLQAYLDLEMFRETGSVMAMALRGLSTGTSSGRAPRICRRLPMWHGCISGTSFPFPLKPRRWNGLWINSLVSSL